MPIHILNHSFFYTQILSEAPVFEIVFIEYFSTVILQDATIWLIDNELALW